MANNLNDIGKDNPDMLFATAARWSEGASDERLWLIRHALRSAVKRGETGALAVLGFGAQPKVEISQGGAQIHGDIPSLGLMSKWL